MTHECCKSTLNKNYTTEQQNVAPQEIRTSRGVESKYVGTGVNGALVVGIMENAHGAAFTKRPPSLNDT